MIKVSGMNISTIDTPPDYSSAYSLVTAGLNIGPEIDWDPDHLVLSAWLEHVPFAFWMMKVLRPACLVELGTERGASYAAFCQAVDRLELGARCYAVDTWCGDEHAGHYDELVFHQIAELNDRRFRRFSTLLRTTFAEALPYFADGEIDLLHIDGLHTYEAVAEDFRTWRPKLSGQAVVLFHDINVRRDDFGVWRLWQELQAEFPHFEFVHGHGLGVIGVGQNLSAPVRALFDASARADLQVAVRGLFAARGGAVQRAFDLKSARQHATALSTDLASLTNETAALREQAIASRQQIDASQAAALSAQAMAAANQAALEVVQTALAASEAAAESSRAASAASQAETASLRHQLAEMSAKANSLRDQLDNATAELDQLNHRLVSEIAAARDDQIMRSSQVSDAASQEIIAALKTQLAAAEDRSAALLASTSWKITAPLRAVKTARARRQLDGMEPGVPSRSGLLGRVLPGVRPIASNAALPAASAVMPRDRIFPAKSQLDLLQLRVLLVAELSVPQCKKYRVDQKRDMIEALGWDCSVVPWQETDRVLSLMQTHTVVIFYRVPAVPGVLQCIEEAAALGLPHYFEVDDLIFDIDDYAANPNIGLLDTASAKGLFDGALLYRQALIRCRNVIASTPYLAERMQSVGGGASALVENALDTETMAGARTTRRPKDGRIHIFYGSGTRTHDADFALIAPALKRVADHHENVDIILVGELNPPEELLRLNRFTTRVRQLPACPYPEYLALLAAADIGIAPLAPVNFNEAKSNIKFLEAAAVGLPSVCSPRSAFADAIRHNETGLLAEGTDQWYDALTSLIINPDLRTRIGEAARKQVFERYSPAAIGARQLKPMLSQYLPAPDPRLHILQVNVFYRPQSFGGATIVMEELTRQFHDHPDTRVSVFTTAPAGTVKPYAVERGEENGVPVFRIGLQDLPGWPEEWWGETAAKAFRDVLRALRPDVVHFHAIQGLGAASLEACRAEGIPFVITLHDAWWVCERQFLVTQEGKYCGQLKINLNVCATCVANTGTTVIRNQQLRQALESADMLITPSEHWRRFYIANDFDPERIVANKNGIQLPIDPPPNQGHDPLRFGFIAGAEAVKGFPLLKRVFESLERNDWELGLVNHGLSLGHDSYSGITWDARGTVRIVPAFQAADRDDFYQSIDVLLFPSQWPESFGLTVREALVRNKWVIATDQGGAAEAIEPGVNGTLIPITDDIVPLRNAVLDLLDRKSDLTNWVNPATGNTRDFATQANELRELLASLIATRQTRSGAPHHAPNVNPTALTSWAPSNQIKPAADHAGLLQPRVLLVAELSVPTCKKYRVDQKRDMILALGWDCSVVSWKDPDLAMTLMQTHSLVIFYRTPGHPEVLQMIHEAENLSLPHYFELDDLIFDLNDFATNPNLLGLGSHDIKGLFDGVALYRQALETCRHIIASTPYLAERMQAICGGSSAVIENALDTETLQAATVAQPRQPDGKVRIMYGSGSPTHDADFALIADALKRVLTEHDNVEIVLIGALNPPKSLLDFGARLRRLPACPYPEYLALLAKSDIAVAPLIASNFNEAKSNIKFLEASAMGVPSVCSRISAFVRAIHHNETGFLAETTDDWYTALTALVGNPALRRRMGESARRDVLKNYSPEAIGRRQVHPVLARHQPAPDPRLHVLQVNILCHPQTFGGATLVMQEMVRRLNDRADTRVSIFTSAPAGWLKPYEVKRSDIEGVPVFRVGIQDRDGWPAEAWDETAGEAFRQVLRALRPDVVHFHAMQGLGAATLQVCRQEGVPYVVTLHDAWWLCERQFLVTGDGKFCGQEQINVNVCATCVPNLGITIPRNLRLRQALNDADSLLTPSQHWRRFHIANGFRPEQVVVNENGTAASPDPKPNQGPARLRFGFVGGAEPIKGFPLVKQTFEALDRNDWDLVLVNHGLTIGSDKYADMTWQVRGTVRTVLPFNEATRDEFYNSIDVLLFPSQWPESFGLTVREALLRNKWVIATDQGGAAEVIKPGVNGTLIPIGEDIAPLQTAVENLLDRKPDLAGWVNPLPHEIRDFATQANELRDILESVVARATAGQEKQSRPYAAE